MGGYAQENVIPESGNVGIGTLNPNSKLDVHGRVNIDSSLFVNDSITIMGKSKFSGQVELNSLDFETNLENTAFLFLNQGNSVRKIEFPDFAKAFTKSVYQNDCFSSGEDGNNTLYTAPIWRSTSVPNSQTGYLYTGVGCPANVGIGTATPRVELDVMGAIFSENLLLIAIH